jgi:hypothetical protein
MLGPARPTPAPRVLRARPSAQGQAALLVVGGDLGCRVKIEAMVLGAQFAFGNGAVVGVEHDADGDGRGEAAWGRGWAGRP